MRTIVFDLDGTLADTSGDLIAAANACFIDMGVGPQLDPLADQATAFHGGRAMLKLGLERLGRADDTAELERQYPRLLAAYAEAIDVHTTLYDGAMEAVATFRENGDKVVICTNKPEGLAETLLQRMGIRDQFDVLIGADTLPVRKPDPAPLRAAIEGAGGDVARAVLIGDTKTDRDCAANLGIPVVLVTFGPGGGTVAALEPEALLSHYENLFVCVEGLLPQMPQKEAAHP